MLFRFLLFSLGILFSSYALTFIIIYLNLLSMGYTFLEYVNFIIRKAECILLLFGIFLIIISMFKRKEKKDDIYL